MDRDVYYVKVICLPSVCSLLQNSLIKLACQEYYTEIKNKQ